MVPGSYKSNKPNYFTGIDEIHKKCECINGSIVNGSREPILYSFASDKSPGFKKCKEPKSKCFKKVNKSILSQINFYLQDDNHKAVDFNKGTIIFTCQPSIKNK